MLNSPFRRFASKLLIFALLLFGFLVNLFAQQPDPSQKQEEKPLPTQQPKQDERPLPTQQPKKEQEPEHVVRISTRLVQIDVVVTDKKGEHIENLNDEDFELSVDGKRQPITYFTLVKLPEPKIPLANKPEKSPNNVTPPPSIPSKMIAPEEVRRTIAFVVDDLGLSFESTYFARRAIKKFVDEQMQEGDLVGIIRTGRGLGALQQFTSDKRILNAALEKMTWNPYSRDMMPRFGVENPGDLRSQESIDAEERFEDFRETVFSVGTLGALNFVVRGLRELPGRKVAILISDGFRLFGRDRDNTQVLDNVRRLTDLANRSSVVIYSIDAKGLQVLFPSAADRVGALSGPQFADQMARVSQANFDSQEGLSYLARETGGFAVLNNNDLNVGIQKALRDTQSYYLIGFDPEDEKFDRKYHSIKVKAKGTGLQVRTRAGFIGFPDGPSRDEALTQLAGPEARNRQILSALFSPFGARDLSLQMTSFFFNTEQGVSFVRSLFHIDPSKLTFKEDPENKDQKILKLEIASFTFNENGAVVDQHGRAFELKFDEEKYKRALEKGLLYNDDFLIKKPGAYQFRAVLRDPETGRLGSAGQFIQVPDLTKKRLAVSGLVLSSPTGRPESQSSTTPESKQNTQQTEESSDVNRSPAVRRFSRTGEIDYGAAIYNVSVDPKTGEPQVTSQIEIFHNGKSIYLSPARAVTWDKNNPGKRLQCQGTLKLKGFPTGDFMMRLIVTDALAKEKYSRAEQWMDFGVR